MTKPTWVLAARASDQAILDRVHGILATVSHSAVLANRSFHAPGQQSGDPIGAGSAEPALLAGVVWRRRCRRRAAGVSFAMAYPVSRHCPTSILPPKRRLHPAAWRSYAAKSGQAPHSVCRRCGAAPWRAAGCGGFPTSRFGAERAPCLAGVIWSRRASHRGHHPIDSADER